MDTLHDLIECQRVALVRCKAEKETIIGALRKLVEVWNVPDPTGDWGPPSELLVKNLREAEELLRLIDIAARFT